MRHAYNLFSIRRVASQLDVSLHRVKRLYTSKVHGSKDLEQFLECSDNVVEDLIERCEKEEFELHVKINDVYLKNVQLISQLKTKVPTKQNGDLISWQLHQLLPRRLG